MKSAYPVTQYLIERYYESRGSLIPDGLHLKDHRSSEELFNDITSPGLVAGSMVTSNGDSGGSPEDSEESIGEEFSLPELPSESLFVRWFTRINSVLSMGTNSYGYATDLKIKDLQMEQAQAISYLQWRATGLRLDELMGLEDWKLEPKNDLYDYDMIAGLTRQLRECRINEDYAKLLYLIRINWVRHLGNMGDVNLYTHCNVGTKTIIEEYLEESELDLHALLLQDELDASYVLGILQQTKRNIGKSALVLSGGATFGLFHIGVIAVLFEAQLIPKVISGTSAGAIVASIFCVHTREEIPSLLANVLDMEFNIFKDEKDKSSSEDFLLKLSRFLKGGSWFESKHLMNTMIKFLGNMTFKEAYYRTGKILNITVSSASIFEQPRVLNNLTASNVLIWSAVCASCSVPGIFPATPLYEKDPKTGETREWLGEKSTKFLDGSVDNDLPTSRLSEMFNVDHIIACQVNPHVFPLLKTSNSCVGGQVQNRLSTMFKSTMTDLYKTVSNELIYMLEMSGELGIAPVVMAKMRSVLSQKYTGNITILPDLNMLLKFDELLKNPSRTFLLEETTLGARATWPKVSMIKNNCGQEFALDRSITFLQTKVLMSSAIKNSLQFVDGSFGLVRLSDDQSVHNKNKNKTKDNDIEENRDTGRQILEDNLFETEARNALMFIRKSNDTSDRRLRSMSLKVDRPTNIDVNDHLTLDLPNRPPVRSGKSISFSSIPSTRSRRSGTLQANMIRNNERDMKSVIERKRMNQGSPTRLIPELTAPKPQNMHFKPKVLEQQNTHKFNRSLQQKEKNT
ncbi:triacylglycerol lipase KNAG_0L02020 [Huiozyma naganishii CBS 8797]|uniref:Patatin-like phospholipase domain-containing protein n=1 Tax=Huiozyma naganishii (strain ATCC MYA-139 / BCRC 22969 / CBS 8797 / KCTC 17520 / NBRC 10181 / NCYC 3082 / Yp74L-3) TaxID=1071383 RepID=J7SB79_HUIN7|nr:hypothetical protein KNAG_0L02020 [Kazachstania naganishii CBS 8797]CCK72821.1 hypothetical protein KNAG_0L02020 [Kazachstania naganishii CBS 8797]